MMCHQVRIRLLDHLYKTDAACVLGAAEGSQHLLITIPQATGNMVFAKEEPAYGS